ncbi:receptor-like protein 9DC3 [Syzygium oleosum]|uniref:receptor-like protein 9DC3 n=1 Tax=Syzygium oleosum TaxID=219896 RepID=UPI0024B94680|nr:receptor-like protein 9DC3 [Syzygium oleosum]
MNREDGQDGSLYMKQSFQWRSYENSVTVTMKRLEIELVKILTVFTTIDLSHNSFQGDIPGVIGHLHSLIGLNLSHNHLTGLCGTPLPKSCPSDAQPPPQSSLSTFDPEVHEWFKQKVVWLGYASEIVIGISITYMAFEMGRPKWLVQVVRILKKRAAEWMEKSKRKAIKFHG